MLHNLGLSWKQDNNTLNVSQMMKLPPTKVWGFKTIVGAQVVNVPALVLPLCFHIITPKDFVLRTLTYSLLGKL